MVRARGAWSPTAAVLKMIYDANRDPNKTPDKTMDDFNPFIDSPAYQRISAERFADLLCGST